VIVDTVDKEIVAVITIDSKKRFHNITDSNKKYNF